MPMPMPPPGKPPGGAPPMGAPAGGPPKPQLPGNPMGGPSGPGGSPMTSPGAGAGREAAADAQVQAIIPTLHKVLNAYPVGDKKYKAVLESLRALTANFGKENQKALVPAAIQQMAMNAKSGGGAPPAPPPGLSEAPLPGPEMGGAGPGM